MSKSISDQRQNRIQTLCDKHTQRGQRERERKGKEMRTVPYRTITLRETQQKQRNTKPERENKEDERANQNEEEE